MIYFAQHDKTSLIKIGMTRNLPSRLYNLRSVYGDMTLLGLLAGYKDTERSLHRKFKADNTPFPYPVMQINNGATEWFKPSKLLLDFISKKTKLIIPIDLFADSMTYGNGAYYPDGCKPRMINKQTDMLSILHTEPVAEAKAA